VQFEERMVGWNSTSIHHTKTQIEFDGNRDTGSSPFQLNCAREHLDPNDPGEMKRTWIEPAFWINIHDPKTDIAVSQEIIDTGALSATS
jgi:hypothetical protein